MYPARYGGDKGMSEDKKKEFWIHVGKLTELPYGIRCV